MVKLTGNKDWIKASEAQSGEQVKFVNEGAWEESKFTHPDGNPKHQFVVKVIHKGEEKTLTLNKVTRDNLTASWSNDTADWVGKTATIEKVKVMVGGAMRDSIILTAVGGQEVQKTPEEPSIDVGAGEEEETEIPF